MMHLNQIELRRTIFLRCLHTRHSQPWQTTDKLRMKPGPSRLLSLGHQKYGGFHLQMPARPVTAKKTMQILATSIHQKLAFWPSGEKTASLTTCKVKLLAFLVGFPCIFGAEFCSRTASARWKALPVPPFHLQGWLSDRNHWPGQGSKMPKENTSFLTYII